MRRIVAVVASLLLASLVAHADVGTWSFIKIAEGPNAPFSTLPAINARGEAVFLDVTNNILWVGDGTSLKALYQESDDFLAGVGGNPDINAAGTVVFFGNRLGEVGLFAGSGGKEPVLITSLIGNGGTINNRGVVAFSSGNEGVFVGTGDDLPITVAAVDGPLSGFDGSVINDRGVVTFHALFDVGGGGIFIGDGRMLQTVADSSGPLHFDGNFGRHSSINNAGEVVFTAALDAGGQGVFSWHRGVLTTLAITTGRGFDDQSVSINNSGDVAFKLDGAIYLSSRGELKRVIGAGDSLLGSTVAGIGFGWHGLNDAGELAFFASLRDGRRGIYRAQPR